MKSTKEMQLKSNAQVKKEAGQQLSSVNTNPTYLMRKMNKLAEGKDSDFNELSKEGLSKDSVCEQYNRLQEVAKCGGYWWGSIIARGGYCITAARKVVTAEGDENGEDVKGLYVAKGGEVLTEMINGELYSLKAAASWNYTNIVASAALFLKFKEEAAAKAGNPYTWQQAQATAKAKEQEARKEEAKKRRKAASEARKVEASRVKEVARRITELQQAFTDGRITQEEAAVNLAAMLAA